MGVLSCAGTRFRQNSQQAMPFSHARVKIPSLKQSPGLEDDYGLKIPPVKNKKIIICPVQPSAACLIFSSHPTRTI